MMNCRGCGKEFADDFSFCPYCGNQKETKKVCASCAKEYAVEFSFCPYCGKVHATEQTVPCTSSPVEPVSVALANHVAATTAPVYIAEPEVSGKVALRNPRTGETKYIKTGWSWTIFFFGVITFLVREMYWFVALWAVLFTLGLLARGTVAIIPLLIVDIAVNIYLSLKGNELQAKQLLEKGWEFAAPDSAATRDAKMQWGMAVAPVQEQQRTAIASAPEQELPAVASVQEERQSEDSSGRDSTAVLYIVIFVLCILGTFLAIYSLQQQNAPAASTSPYGQTAGQYPTTHQSSAPSPTGASEASRVADIQKQAISLFKQKQYTEARPLFDQACSSGEMSACNYLGYLYAQGLGGTRNTRKAHELYQIACDQGTLTSCASLGSLYQDAGDTDNAKKYFQKACDGGVTDACDLERGVQ